VLPAAIERIRRKLASTDDGNRQMVDILNAVLTDGLPAVEASAPSSAACLLGRSWAGRRLWRRPLAVKASIRETRTASRLHPASAQRRRMQGPSCVSITRALRIGPARLLQRFAGSEWIQIANVLRAPHLLALREKLFSQGNGSISLWPEDCRNAASAKPWSVVASRWDQASHRPVHSSQRTRLSTLKTKPPRRVSWRDGLAMVNPDGDNLSGA